MPMYWLGAGACLLIAGRSAAHQQHPVRAILGSVLCGLAALALVDLLAPCTGITLPLNRTTAFAAAVLGLPGVIALLALNLIFMGI